MTVAHFFVRFAHPVIARSEIPRSAGLVPARMNIRHIGGTAISSVGPASCRSLVTPDFDSGASLDSRVRGNDDGWDAHPTVDCIAALPMTYPERTSAIVSLNAHVIQISSRSQNPVCSP